LFSPPLSGSPEETKIAILMQFAYTVCVEDNSRKQNQKFHPLKVLFGALRELYSVFIKTKSLTICRLVLVLTLFKGEKTNLFWAGSLIVGLASWLIFTAVWSLQTYLPFVSDNLRWWIQSNVPYVVGSAVFILIGLFMMKSGVKKNPIPIADKTP